MNNESNSTPLDESPIKNQSTTTHVNEKEIKILGNMDYIISFENGGYQVMMSIDIETQLVSHCMVRDTMQNQLDDKAKKWDPEQKQRTIQFVHMLNNTINDLASYLHDQKKNAKPKSNLILPPGL